MSQETAVPSSMPLWLACLNENVAAVRHALDTEPELDVNSENNETLHTPLGIAIYNNDPAVAAILLADRRLDLTKEVYLIGTSLMHACKFKRATIMRQILISREGEWKMSDRPETKAALDICLEKQWVEGVKLLIRFGCGTTRILRTYTTELTGPLKDIGDYVFQHNLEPWLAYKKVRRELQDIDAARVYALVISCRDGWLSVKDTATEAARFLTMMTKLPSDTQMTICYMRDGVGRTGITSPQASEALNELALCYKQKNDPV